MCLVLEIDKPFLILAVHPHRHHDAAGVDLVAHLLVVQQSGFAQPFGSQCAHIHQAYVFVRASFVLLFVVGQILLESGLNQRAVLSFVKLDIGQLRSKGRVAAVVAPVGVQHTNLGHAGVALLLVAEITLYVQEVGKGHSKAQRAVQFFQLILGHSGETVEYLHIGRLVVVLCQRFGFG